jgi:hypothetical protein
MIVFILVNIKEYKKGSKVLVNRLYIGTIKKSTLGYYYFVTTKENRKGYWVSSKEIEKLK